MVVIRLLTAARARSHPAYAQALLADPVGFDPDQLDPDRRTAPHFELVVHLTPEMVASMSAGGGFSWAHNPTTWIAAGARGSLKSRLTQAVADWCGRESPARSGSSR